MTGNLISEFAEAAQCCFENVRTFPERSVLVSGEISVLCSCIYNQIRLTNVGSSCCNTSSTKGGRICPGVLLLSEPQSLGSLPLVAGDSALQGAGKECSLKHCQSEGTSNPVMLVKEMTLKLGLEGGFTSAKNSHPVIFFGMNKSRFIQNKISMRTVYVLHPFIKHICVIKHIQQLGHSEYKRTGAVVRSHGR